MVIATDLSSIIGDVTGSSGGTSDLLGSLALGGFAGVGLQQLGVFEEGGLFGAASQAGSRAGAAQAAGKQQGIETLTQELSPFRDAGLQGLAGFQQGSTAEGFGANLEELLSGGALQGLVQERGRAVQGQLAAGGLTRSGAGIQAAAAVPTDLALQIEQMLSQRQGGLAETGFQAARGIGGGVAALQSGIGQDIGSGIVTDAQAKAGQQQQLFQLATTAASFFSDPKLKTNTKVIGHIGPLTLYSWDWIPETIGTIIENFPRAGFMADQVKDKFPQFIQEFGGFMTVDMGNLLNKLEADYGNA